MQTEGQRELEAAQNTPSDADQNDNVIEPELDESGAVEAAEYAGKDIADAVDKDILDNVYKAAEEEEVVAAHEAPVSKHPVELPITHLKNPQTRRVFEATPELMKRKDLLPCDEDGKNVLDHRRFG